MNALFDFVAEQRVNDKTKEPYDVLIVTYKGLRLALFSGDNLLQRAEQYVKTYGYLAEWYFLGHPSWDESMRVNVNG
jgi:hypothetical protein